MVDVPAPVQANWNARSSVPTWASKLGVNPNSVDSLLAGYAAQEDKEESNVGLLDDLFANDLI
jgi:phage terminase small subunit